jgi:hypothetical protein
MSPESIQMLFALLFGFAVAGMCSSGYRVFASRLPSFSPLNTGPVLRSSRQSRGSSCRRRF